MSEMSREKALEVMYILRSGTFEEIISTEEIVNEALDVAIEALFDNKPSRTWIAKNEYRRGWHDAITKALSETLKIYVGNEIFDMVQKETLIGLGLSMDSALGAEPYSETEESYPEPERPHGEWLPVIGCDGRTIAFKCKNCGWFKPHNIMPFCENCGSDNRPREGDEK